MVRVGQVCMRSWISRMDPFRTRYGNGAASEREASRLPFSITRISSPAARELRLHELRQLAMRSLHAAEERGRMPPPCTYGMRSAASLSRDELQREVAGLCRTCERRRARMGSRETPRAPSARVGHAHTHTGQGTSHVHVVPQSSRAGHHSVPGKWHDCLRRAHPPHPAHPASSAAHGCALKSPIPRGGAFLWGYPVESPVARSPIA